MCYQLHLWARSLQLFLTAQGRSCTCDHCYEQSTTHSWTVCLAVVLAETYLRTGQGHTTQSSAHVEVQEGTVTDSFTLGLISYEAVRPHKVL